MVSGREEPFIGRQGNVRTAGGSVVGLIGKSVVPSMAVLALLLAGQVGCSFIKSRSHLQGPTTGSVSHSSLYELMLAERPVEVKFAEQMMEPSPGKDVSQLETTLRDLCSSYMGSGFSVIVCEPISSWFVFRYPTGALPAGLETGVIEVDAEDIDPWVWGEDQDSIVEQAAERQSTTSSLIRVVDNSISSPCADIVAIVALTGKDASVLKRAVCVMLVGYSYVEGQWVLQRTQVYP